MKIRRLGAELFHVDRRADGHTDMTKLIVAFRNSANSPKRYSFVLSNLHAGFNFLFYSTFFIFPRMPGIGDRSIV
jgi:hypothetical protein